MKPFGIAGYSGAGKTTLIEALIPLFRARSLSVSLIKHTHHDFDLDRPGKDSWRHRAAGAGEVMLVCDQRWAILHELHGAPEPPFAEQLQRLSPCDLVLVEGFKYTPIPKLEVHRPANGKPLIWPENDDIVALATDAPALLAGSSSVFPIFDLNNRPAIADFILNYMQLA